MNENNMTYEEVMARLDEIIEKLNSSSVSLDESLALFEEGTKLTALCKKKLNDAKQKITEIEKE